MLPKTSTVHFVHHLFMNTKLPFHLTPNTYTHTPKNGVGVGARPQSWSHDDIAQLRQSSRDGVRGCYDLGHGRVSG